MSAAPTPGEWAGIQSKIEIGALVVYLPVACLVQLDAMADTHRCTTAEMAAGLLQIALDGIAGVDE